MRFFKKALVIDERAVLVYFFSNCYFERASDTGFPLKRGFPGLLVAIKKKANRTIKPLAPPPRALSTGQNMQQDAKY